MPKLVMRAIKELKIKCQSCKKVFTLDEIDNHTKSCMKPKCAGPDCSVLEEEMKRVYKVILIIKYSINNLSSVLYHANMLSCSQSC